MSFPPARILATLALIALASCNRGSGPVAPEALPAAQAWLALVDAGQYPASWTEAAPYFKQAVDSKRWEAQVGAVRGPLGAVKTRVVKSQTALTSVPGGPDGEYVVIQFDSSFAKKEGVVETVTPMKDVEGHWRVSGYYVR